MQHFIEVFTICHSTGFGFSVKAEFSYLSEIPRKPFKYVKNNRQQYVCLQCNRVYLTYSGLSRHVQKHFNTQPYRCKICGKGFTEMYHFQGHLTVHGKEKLKCDKCDKSFGYRSNLRRHKSKCLAGIKPLKKEPVVREAFVCQICGYTCSRQDILRDHINCKHGSEPQHQCKVCKKSFSWRSTLSKHKRLHSK